MSDSDTTQYYNTGVEGRDSPFEAVSDITSRNLEQTEVTAPHGNKNNEKLKARGKSVRFEDNGMECLKQNEVLSNMVNKEDIYEVQQTPPSSNSSKTTTQSKNKEAASGEASTPTRKRRNISRKKGKGGVSSSRVVNDMAPSNSGQSEATAPNEGKNKEKPKPGSKSKKKEVNAKKKPKQGNAIPTYHPQQFIGLYVFKEYHGTKSLGSVIAYCSKKKMLQVRYDGNRMEYMEQNEVLKNMAKQEDIFQARQALPPSNSLKKTAEKEKESNSSKKTGDKEKEKAALLGEGSTPTKKRRNISTGPKV